MNRRLFLGKLLGAGAAAAVTPPLVRSWPFRSYFFAPTPKPGDGLITLAGCGDIRVGSKITIKNCKLDGEYFVTSVNAESGLMGVRPADAFDQAPRFQNLERIKFPVAMRKDGKPIELMAGCWDGSELGRGSYTAWARADSWEDVKRFEKLGYRLGNHGSSALS